MNKKLVLLSLLVVLVLGGGYLVVSRSSLKTSSISLKVPTKSTVGQILEVPLLIKVPSAINAGEFVFNFPTDLLAVKEIRKDGSIYQLWISGSPSFSNTDGTISLAGGLPSPGFVGEGKVATVIFETKKAGVAEISLDESRSRLLANDGLGTALPAHFQTVRLKVR